MNRQSHTKRRTGIETQRTSSIYMREDGVPISLNKSGRWRMLKEEIPQVKTSSGSKQKCDSVEQCNPYNCGAGGYGKVLILRNHAEVDARKATMTGDGKIKKRSDQLR